MLLPSEVITTAGVVSGTLLPLSVSDRSEGVKVEDWIGFDKVTSNWSTGVVVGLGTTCEIEVTEGGVTSTNTSKKAFAVLPALSTVMTWMLCLPGLSSVKASEKLLPLIVA